MHTGKEHDIGRHASFWASAAAEQGRLAQTYGAAKVTFQILVYNLANESFLLLCLPQQPLQQIRFPFQRIVAQAA